MTAGLKKAPICLFQASTQYIGLRVGLTESPVKGRSGRQSRDTASGPGRRGGTQWLDQT